MGKRNIRRERETNMAYICWENQGASSLMIVKEMIEISSLYNTVYFTPLSFLVYLN